MCYILELATVLTSVMFRLKGGVIRVTNVETFPPDSFKPREPKKRPAIKIEVEPPKRKKAEGESLLVTALQILVQHKSVSNLGFL